MQHRTSYWLPAAGILIPLAMLLLLPRWTVDDAFISYRYGANLLHHGELTWNPGEAPVEGYTGILLPLLAAFLLKLGIPLLMGVKALSTLATCGTALLLNSALKNMDVGPRFRALTLALFLLSPMIYVHQSSGLETSIFTFLLSAALYFHFYVISENTKIYQSILYILLLIATSLTRPEGALASLLCLGGQLVFHWKAGRKARGILIALGWAVPASLYFAWRLNYYGEWLPNSFAAKQSGGLANPESLKALARFAGQYLMLPMAAAGLLWVLSADQLSLDKKKNARLNHLGIVFGAFFAACMLVYLRSDLFMNYASRFFAPFFPPLLFLCGLLLSRGWEQVQAQKSLFPVRTKILSRLLLVFAALQLGIFAFKWRGELNFVRYYQRIVEDEYLPAAKYLKESLPDDATLICYMDAGAIPYYSGLRTIDFGRLNDSYLARQKPDPEAVIDYFFQVGADAVVMTSEAEQKYIYLDEADRIMSDPRFDQYVLKHIFGNDSNFPYFQWVFVRQSLDR